MCWLVMLWHHPMLSCCSGKGLHVPCVSWPLAVQHTPFEAKSVTPLLILQASTWPCPSPLLDNRWILSTSWPTTRETRPRPVSTGPRGYRAHRAVWPTQAIAIGVEIPPEAWGGNIINLPEVTTRATYARDLAAGAQYGLMLWSIHMPGCPNAQQITSAACTAYSMPGCSTPLPTSQQSCSGAPPSTPSPSPSTPPASPPAGSSPSPALPPATASPSPAPASGGSCTTYAQGGGSCGAAAGGACCPSAQCCSQYGEWGNLKGCGVGDKSLKASTAHSNHCPVKS
jgi:hypothetical protein